MLGAWDLALQSGWSFAPRSTFAGSVPMPRSIREMLCAAAYSIGPQNESANTPGRLADAYSRGRRVDHRERGAVVVVDAAASELERLAVEPEAGLGAELEAPDPERCRRRIDDLPVDAELRLEPVELRCRR